MGSILSVFLFESPSVLWGVSLIVVPILVHLFNLRKAKRIEFSNISLLKKVSEETNAKKRPIELIILLLRIIGILLIVMAFAMPIVKSSDSDETVKDQTTLYLDNSQSMAGLTSGGSKFDQAYSLLTGVVDSYSNDGSFRLVENAYKSSASTDLTKASLDNSLASLGLVGVDRSVEELVSRFSAGDISSDVYWFSDFSATSDLELLARDSLRNHYLVSIQGSEQVNIYIDSAYLENTFYSGEFVNNIVVDISATDRVSKSVNLRFTVGAQLLGTAQVVFDNTDKVSYNYSIPTELTDLSKMRISLEGNDPEYDNEFYLSINELNRVSVLEVFDVGSNDFIPSLYENNELFAFQRLNLNSLQSTSFESADFLILNELSSFSNQLIGYVNTFLEEGGTLLLLPNTGMAVDTFDRLGIRLQEDDSFKMDLKPIDFENPFFEGIFEEQDLGIKMPEATAQWRPINYEYALLSFRNERPFLSKLVSNNDIFFVSSSLSNEYSSFATHAIFVPIMYKLALGAQSNANRLYYQTDSEFMSFPVNEGNNEVYKLSSADSELIPNQRIANGQLLMDIPKDEISVGQYYLKGDTDTLGVMSFNLPKSESIYNDNLQVQLDELSNYDHIQVLNLETKEEAMSFVNNNLRGQSLWRYFLLAAVLFLFAEIILIRYL